MLFSTTGLEIQGTKLFCDKHSAVIIIRNPSNPEQALAWVAMTSALAIPGLGLGFQGNEATNILKGEWPVGSSSMSVEVAQSDGRTLSGTKVKMAMKHSLITLD